MNKNSDWYELSVWILNIFQMNRRFTRDCFNSWIIFVHGKSAKIKVSEKKASQWIKDVCILYKRH